VRARLLFALGRLSRLGWGVRNPGIALDPTARVQRPSTLRADLGAKIRVGKHSVLYERSFLTAVGTGAIEVGDHCILGDVRVFARTNVKIGNRVVMSWNVYIQDYASHPKDPDLRGLQLRQMTEPRGLSPVEAERLRAWVPPSREIVIGDDVWIGANATLLPGARLGRGCIVGASAVVPAGEYPDGSTLVGVPARAR